MAEATKLLAALAVNTITSAPANRNEQPPKHERHTSANCSPHGMHKVYGVVVQMSEKRLRGEVVVHWRSATVTSRATELCRAPSSRSLTTPRPPSFLTAEKARPDPPAGHAALVCQQ
ncbi:hypothetical protein VTI28DRAFT_1510 [Corynascus sepedonium]